jgi:hypothetical protein
LAGVFLAGVVFVFVVVVVAVVVVFFFVVRFGAAADLREVAAFRFLPRAPLAGVEWSSSSSCSPSSSSPRPSFPWVPPKGKMTMPGDSLRTARLAVADDDDDEEEEATW